MNIMENSLLIIGAGGHGKSVADAAITTGEWDNIAFLNDKKYGIETVLGYPVLGDFKDYIQLSKFYKYIFPAIGDNEIRFSIYKKLKAIGVNIPTIIHQSANVSKFASICAGTVIMAGAYIGPDTRIGECCIINTNTSVDHDCIIENGVHISPGASVSGSVHIKEMTWVCVGAKIADHITVGANCTIAGSAMIIGDIPSNVMVAGVPGTIKKRI